MSLLAILVRMAMRYSRWIARGVAFTAATVAFAVVEQRETILLPGMSAPYEIAPIDPYLAFGVTFIVTVRLLTVAMMRFHDAARTHVANLRNR